MQKVRFNRNYQQGLTFPEVMTVLLIMSVLVSFAGPSLGEMVKQTRLRSEADRVLTSLNYARSEAIKLNSFVSICRSSDGGSCTGGWNDGWIVFSDNDGDGVVDGGDGDTVLSVYAGLPESYSFSSDISSSYLSYFADGSYASGAGTIRICSYDADTENSYSIFQSTVGRPRISKGTTSCP